MAPNCLHRVSIGCTSSVFSQLLAEADSGLRQRCIWQPHTRPAERAGLGDADPRAELGALDGGSDGGAAAADHQEIECAVAVGAGDEVRLARLFALAFVRGGRYTVYRSTGSSPRGALVKCRTQRRALHCLTMGGA
jgi:hypothetical protein